MPQLVYPANIQAEATHAVLFSINVVTNAAATLTNRPIENALVEDNPVVRNPNGGTPIIYQQNTGARVFPTMELDNSAVVNRTYKRIEDSIVLQMPNEKTVSYGLEWRQSELGKAASASRAAGIMKDLVKEMAPGSNQSADVKGKLASLAKFNDSDRTIAGAAQSITNYNLKDLTEFKTGKVLNPMIETLFQGVANQVYPFTFVFYPKNQKESFVVEEIINQFRFHAHPELIEGGAPYYLYPSTFDITFLLETKLTQNKWMYETSTCALVSIVVTDSEATHSDGSPILRELSLVFSDLEQKHKGRFVDNGPDINDV